MPSSASPFYRAQVLEYGIQNLAVLFTMKRHPTPTREAYLEVSERLDSKTMGNLIREARKLIRIEADLDEKIQLALACRNVLAHRFFKERAAEFLSDPGREQMIKELQGDIELLKEVDEAIDEIYLPLAQKQGITEDVVECYLREMQGYAGTLV